MLRNKCSISRLQSCQPWVKCQHTHSEKKTNARFETTAWQRWINSSDHHLILCLSANRRSSPWTPYRRRCSRVFTKDEWKSGHESLSNCWWWHHRTYLGMKPPSPAHHVWPMQRQSTWLQWQSSLSSTQRSCQPYLYGQPHKSVFLSQPENYHAENRTVEEN